MNFEAMKDRVRGIPEVTSWPQMLELIERPIHREAISVWEYPVAACRAVVGGLAPPAAGAARRGRARCRPATA